MSQFRFQDLRIWQRSIDITDELFDLADQVEKRRRYRFPGQLRGAGMSMSNFFGILCPGLILVLYVAIPLCRG